MKISFKQSSLIYDYFHNEETFAAINLFNGIVFKHLDLKNYQKEEWDYLDKHLLINSPLYGILRYNDAVNYHRLEMKHKLNEINLYQYWYKELNDYLKNEDVILSLSTKEYEKMFDLPIIQLDFVIRNGHTFKRNAVYLKKASAAETVYNEVVRQVLLKAAGQAADSKLTADQAAAGIKAAWAKGAQANDQTSTVMYAVSDGMTSAQLAELLYAKSGAKDTLFHKTQSTIKAQLAAGRNNEQVTDGVESSLKTLATQLAGACQNVAVQAASAAAVTGAESAKATIAQQIEAVQENGYSLVTGSAALSKGTQSLADAVPTLTKGIKALNDATVKIVSGVDKLDDGSHTLADGMVEFDEKGISKIANSYNGDIKPLTDKLQAMLDAGEDYQTFTKVADGVNGSVKFIYKQDAIKADSENNK